MKKNELFLKSLIGVPVGIFFLEMLNMCLSIRIGKYVRFEIIETGVFDLNSILVSYLFCAVTSYLFMIYLKYIKHILELGLPVKEERKANKKVYPILMVNLIIMIIAFYTENLAAMIGGLVSYVWSGIVIAIMAVQTLLNRNNIKQINEKLKDLYKK